MAVIARNSVVFIFVLDVQIAQEFHNTPPARPELLLHKYRR